MAEITVTAGTGSRDGATFEVEVRDAGDSDVPHGHGAPRYARRASDGTRAATEELVRASFAFLLEREPARSILRRFSLDVIGDYFPEYAAEMARRARVSN